MNPLPDSTTPISLAMIGVGDMARHHLRAILPNFPDTVVPVVCEPSDKAYRATAELFEEAGREVPANEPDLAKMLADYAGQIDAVFIITPHVYHHDQAKACGDSRQQRLAFCRADALD